MEEDCDYDGHLEPVEMREAVRSSEKAPGTSPSPGREDAGVGFSQDIASDVRTSKEYIDTELHQ